MLKKKNKRTYIHILTGLVKNMVGIMQKKCYGSTEILFKDCKIGNELLFLATRNSD